MNPLALGVAQYLAAVMHSASSIYLIPSCDLYLPLTMPVFFKFLFPQGNPLPPRSFVSAKNVMARIAVVLVYVWASSVVVEVGPDYGASAGVRIWPVRLIFFPILTQLMFSTSASANLVHECLEAAFNT